jgi:hypothetical protein
MLQGLRFDLSTHHFMKMSSGHSVGFTRAMVSVKSAVLRNLCTDKHYGTKLCKIHRSPVFLTPRSSVFYTGKGPF